MGQLRLSFQDPVGMDVLGIQVFRLPGEAEARPAGDWLTEEDHHEAVRSGRELGFDSFEDGSGLVDWTLERDGLPWWLHQAYTFYEGTPTHMAWNKAFLLSRLILKLWAEAPFDSVILEGAADDPIRIAKDLGRHQGFQVQRINRRHPPLASRIREGLGERGKTALRFANWVSTLLARRPLARTDILYLANGAHDLRWNGAVGFHVFAPVQQALASRGIRQTTLYVQNRFQRPAFVRHAFERGYAPFEAMLGWTSGLSLLLRSLTPRAGQKPPILGERFDHMGLSSYFARKFRPLPAWRARETRINLETYQRALEDLKPRLVVLSDEASSHGLCMIDACRRAGIPTVAIQHGVIHAGHFGYVHCSREAEGGPPPLLADQTLLFGSFFREIVLEHGHYPPDQAIVVGSARYDSLLLEPTPAELEAFRRQHDLPLGRPLVVFLSQPFPDLGQRERYLQAVCQATAKLPGAVLAIKPHPMEADLSRHAQVPKDHKLEARLLPGVFLGHLFRCADLAVAVNSTTLIEALLAGCPALTMNFSGAPEVVPFSTSGACLKATSPEDLATLLPFALSRGREDATFQNARRTFLQAMIGPMDGQATQRTAERLLEALGRPAEARPTRISPPPSDARSAPHLGT